jgi:ERCC4-type nuclease
MFCIVADSREKEPYIFECPTVSHKLDAGDYSVEGLESVVAVERKSLADFTSTVMHDFQRFAVELEKLAAMEAACIVVEADLDAVLRGKEAETLHNTSPGSLLGAAQWLSLRFGVPIYWCGSRQAGRAFTDGFLRMFVRTRKDQHGHTWN